MNILQMMFPKYALKRQIAKDNIVAYEAAKQTRIHNPKRESQIVDDLVERAGRSLTEQARWLDSNHDLASSVLDILTRSVVGMGLEPDPLIRDQSGNLMTDLNKLISDLWANWVEDCDLSGENEYYAIQRLKLRSFLRDGEIFTHHLFGNIPGFQTQSEVPLFLELLESDSVDISFSDKKRNITQGIQKNSFGRVTNYWVNPDLTDYASNYIPVKASEIAHIKLCKRVNQTRGVSIFQNTLIRLSGLENYESSELVAARMAAAVVGVVTKGDPASYQSPTTNLVNDGTQKRNLEFNPGSIIDELAAGETLDIPNTNRPNSGLSEFRDSMLRAVASGVGVNFSSLSNKFEASYSAMREARCQQELQYNILWSYFVRQSEVKTYKKFVLMGELAGLFSLEKANRRTIFDASWSKPIMPWIDPKKEIESSVLALKSNIETLEDVWLRAGKKPRNQWAKLAEQQKKMEEMGLVFETQKEKNDG